MVIYILYTDHKTTYLYNQTIVRFPNLNNIGPVIIKAIVSGRYNNGTKKYVNASLGGNGFSAGGDILSYIFSLGSIIPA